MLLAAETGVDLARILLDLLVVLAAAKCAAELAERIRVPAVLGEIAAGIVIGPSMSGLIHLGGSRGVSLAVLAEIGVLLLLVGIFANGKYGAGWNGSSVAGVEGLIKGEVGQLGIQAIGVVVIWTVILGIAYAFFKIQNALTKGGIRPDEAMETEGMDMPEMGALAYAD